MSESFLLFAVLLLDFAGHELLLFAGVWFAVGAIDEFAVDCIWLSLWFRGKIGSRVNAIKADTPLKGVAAVFVPAWREAAVVGAMVRHSLSVWPQRDLRIYVGCYRNDPETLAALVAAAPNDPRLRIVLHYQDGPTTKADCLNRLYKALCDDEQRGGFTARSIILHDAEDMVHPAALALLDRGLDCADFVQIPVRPEPQPSSQWIAGHYLDEFAESHGKGLVVRDWLKVGLPAAGVGCAFARDAIRYLARLRGSNRPFDDNALTEDYECGLWITQAGGRGRFLRCRDERGDLIATREFFPSTLYTAVRQKTRWLHGIAFQGWERLGWQGGPCEIWMRLRDRRGPFTALVIGAGYLLMLIWPILLLAEAAGTYQPSPLHTPLRWLLGFNAVMLLWRLAFRFAFTTREYGWRQGLLGVFRAPVANVVAMMAGRRAIAAYLRSLRGEAVRWDKTDHRMHPTQTEMAKSL